MVAKFLDDNKPKISLKKWICTVSNFIDLICFHLICQMLAKFSGVESERTISYSLEKSNNYCCFVFIYLRKRAHDIRKFHVTVVQWQLRNAQKSVMHMQSCCFAKIIFLFAILPLNCSHCRCCRCYLSSLLLRSKNFSTMVMWCHTSPLYLPL